MEIVKCKPFPLTIIRVVYLQYETQLMLIFPTTDYPSKIAKRRQLNGEKYASKIQT